MILSIASGKGGTGKTTISVSLALSIDKNLQFIDCDVEEPNAHVFLKPRIENVEEVLVKVPQVDLEKCTFCGECSKVCNYNAIAVVPNYINIFTELCHNCGACQHFCPEGAIFEIDKTIGVVEFGKVYNMDFSQGELKVGQASPVPIIKQLKKNIEGKQHVIIDAPPGSSCAMVQSVIDSNYCILVTEPTPFGLHDLKIAIEVLEKLEIPFGVIINRCDVGNDQVVEYCRHEGIDVLMSIPFSRKIAQSYSIGEPLVEAAPEFKNKFIRLFEKLEERYG